MPRASAEAVTASARSGFQGTSRNFLKELEEMVGGVSQKSRKAVWSLRLSTAGDLIYLKHGSSAQETAECG